MKTFRLSALFVLIAGVLFVGAWALGWISKEEFVDKLPRMLVLIVVVGAGLGVGLSVMGGKSSAEKDSPPNSGPRF